MRANDAGTVAFENWTWESKFVNSTTPILTTSPLRKNTHKLARTHPLSLAHTHSHTWHSAAQHGAARAARAAPAQVIDPAEDADDDCHVVLPSTVDVVEFVANARETLQVALLRVVQCYTHLRLKIIVQV